MQYSNAFDLIRYFICLNLSDIVWLRIEFKKKKEKTVVIPWISTHNGSKNVLCCNERQYGRW